MSAELLPWAIEATAMTTVAILLALTLRPVLARAFGIRAAILIWLLVPLALIVGVLPARSVDVARAAEIQTVISLEGLGTAAAAARDIGQSFSVTWRAVIAAVWLTGAGLMLVVMTCRQARFRRFLGTLRPVGKRLLAADRASTVPAVLGVVRPRVIVPQDFSHRFDTRQRRLMLAHEYTHLKRGDPAWNLVAAGLRCLFWFNPLVHIAVTRFRHDQELACDATVLTRRRHARRAYASALLALEDDSPMPSFGFGAHPLKERIHMLATLKNTSPRRHLAGMLVAVTLAITLAAAAWAANPEMSNREAVVDEPFAFDIEVTVDGRSQTGKLILTGVTGAFTSVDGQPRMLANDTLRLEHNDKESGWAAEVTIDRMAEEKFSVTATIRKNDEVVSTPRMIIGSEAPASIETRDPETGEIAYRLVLTPISPVQAASASSGSNSATLLFTVNGAVELDTPVEFPPAPLDSILISISRDRESKLWDASVSLKRLDIERLELCLESFNLQGVTHSIMEKKGCMIFDEDIQTNAYMKGEFEDAGISWRLDMRPDVPRA